MKECINGDNDGRPETRSGNTLKECYIIIIVWTRVDRMGGQSLVCVALHLH